MGLHIGPPQTKFGKDAIEHILRLVTNITTLVSDSMDPKLHEPSLESKMSKDKLVDLYEKIGFGDLKLSEPNVEASH